MNQLYKDYVYIDEVGRGCAAGPMVFCGLKLKTDEVNVRVKDSKKLNKQTREDLDNWIKKNSDYYLVVTSAKEIDEVGLSDSIKKSLNEIITHFKEKDKTQKFLYDGNKTFGVDCNDLETLVEADDKVFGVSCASILAKNLKDELMEEIHRKFPEYNFKDNAGYLTSEHIEKIKEIGYCDEHRKSYRIKEIEKEENKKKTDFLF